MAWVSLTRQSVAALFPFLPTALKDLNVGIVALVFNLVTLVVVTLLTRAVPRRVVWRLTPDQDGKTMNGIDALLASSKDDLATLRRDLHAHPELRFEEHRTADIVAAELERLGYTVDRGMGASARPE